MLALDTNVLVRYLAQDDVKQSALASLLIEKRLSATQPGFISLVALLETVWVMESRYGADTAAVAAILGDLLETAHLAVQDAQAVRQAVALYREGAVDLHDCLILTLAQQRGATVQTFDTKAAKRLGMTLLR